MCNTEALHGLALHRRAIVRVHRELSLGNPLSLADVTQQPGGQLRAFALKDLPANNFSTEDVHKKVGVEMHAAHGGGQIGVKFRSIMSPVAAGRSLGRVS